MNEGFERIVDLRFLLLFSRDELEKLICGEPAVWSRAFLEDHVQFAGRLTRSDPLAQKFTEVASELSPTQQMALWRFVSGDRRMSTKEIREGYLFSVNVKEDTGEDWLPTAATCIRMLYLPAYVRVNWRYDGRNPRKR